MATSHFSHYISVHLEQSLTIATAFSGYEYAGVEWGVECYCSETFKQPEAISLSDNLCNTPCSGDRSIMCGGYNAISIYTTGAGCKYQ